MKVILGWLFAAIRRAFRHRRYENLQRLLDLNSVTGFVLDLGGGTASFFAALYPRREQIILLDLNKELVTEGRRHYTSVHAIVGDGEALPFADRSVAVTICNSVIEHVHDPAKLARETLRVSQSYFVQTPNGRFPVETHSLIGIPFYNLIPWPRLRRLICAIFGANYAYIESVCYLPEERLRSLFPCATLAYESFLGLKKSFYLYARGAST